MHIKYMKISHKCYPSHCQQQNLHPLRILRKLFWASRCAACGGLREDSTHLDQFFMAYGNWKTVSTASLQASLASDCMGYELFSRFICLLGGRGNLILKTSSIRVVSAWDPNA